MLEARTSSTQFSELEAPVLYTIEPGHRIYACKFFKELKLDVKMLNEDTDWGVVHCKFKKEFFGINAPIDASETQIVEVLR